MALLTERIFDTAKYGTGFDYDPNSQLCFLISMSDTVVVRIHGVCKGPPNLRAGFGVFCGPDSQSNKNGLWPGGMPLHNQVRTCNLSERLKCPIAIATAFMVWFGIDVYS